jgi:hypothetical protein
MNKTVRHFPLTIVYVVCFFSIISFCGCATMNPMALETETGALELTLKSAGLFTLRTSNQFKPPYQPDVKSIEMIPQESDKAVKFKVAKPHNQEKNLFFEYLISVDLSPGIYRIGNITGLSPNFLTIGSFNFPVGASFELSPNAVVYLGHINMVNRKRKEGEKRSGSIIPLIDQAASGYGGGTFDVLISDRSDIDIPIFEQTYPELEQHIIMKNIMKK